MMYFSRNKCVDFTYFLRKNGERENTFLEFPHCDIGGQIVVQTRHKVNFCVCLLFRSYGSFRILANGNVVKIPVASDIPEINISEEVNRSGVWKSLEANVSASNVSTVNEESSKKAAGNG